MTANHDIGALILSGGNSSRMGFPKAFLRLDGQTLSEKLLSVYRAAGVVKSVLVLNAGLYTEAWRSTLDKLSEKALLVKNDFPERDRAYSLQIGLENLSAETGCFIHNVDNPALDARLVSNMVQALKTDRYVVPAYKGQNGHPVLVGSTVLQHLKSLRSADWVLRDELKRFEKTTVDAGATNVLHNLNTKRDWSEFVLSQKQINLTGYSDIEQIQAATNEPLALCIVVATKGSTPRKTGAKMIVSKSGRLFGSIGGGNLEKKAIENALTVIENNQPQVFRHELLQQHEMCCGGTVDIYIEPIMQKNKLYIFGAGHTGQALSNYAADLDFDITVVDDREEYIGQINAPGVKTLCADFEQALNALPFDGHTSVVILTYNHDTDRKILEYCLGKPHAYLGMIGSRRKILVTKKRFRDAGIATAEALDRVDMPIGIDIKAETPQEIAISILAKLIEVKRIVTT
ncbi:MAG: XdhC family protein [Saprospiraceae bacterium]|nr:XdhC family protein [Saprospiraceae bacterium]